jgi:Flp pilus assembly protein TadB
LCATPAAGPLAELRLLVIPNRGLHSGHEPAPSSSPHDGVLVRNHETQPAKLSALVRFYPAFIAMGVVFFVISLWTFEGWHKITAAFWAGLVLLWTQQYRRYRRSTQG